MPPVAFGVLSNIANQASQPLFTSPVERNTRRIQYQDLVRENEQKQAEADKQAKLRQAAQQSGGDRKVFAQLASQIDPVLGAKLQDALSQEERAQQQAQQQAAQEQRAATQAGFTQTENQRTLDAQTMDDNARREDYKQQLLARGEMPNPVTAFQHKQEWERKKLVNAQPPARPEATPDLLQELKAFYPDFDKMTPEQRRQALTDFTASKQAPAKEPQRAQVPGVDVPFPPEVEAQKLRIQKAEAAVKAASSGSTSNDDAGAIADAIIAGDQPPVTTGLYRLAGPVRAALAKKGYDQSTALSDWNATQKHLSTLNGAQQERLRQAITFTSDSIDNIETLYQDWKKAAGVSGVKLFNKATLATAKQLPGEAGAKATALEAQIADLTSELGTVYKGGNSSTDESLRLAAKNLEADWNEQTFKEAVKNIRKNLQIRSNSIRTSQPAGISNSQYSPTPQGATSGTVKMKAPNGQMKDVPANQVEHYKSLGATVVQ